MKKGIKKIIIISLLVTCNLFGCVWHNDEKNEYGDFVSVFEKVEVEDIYEMQEEGKVFFLYTGRKNCEYCVEFVHELSHIVTEENIKIYYLDSVTEYEKSDEELKKFRDSCKIDFVPSLIYFQGKDETMRFDNEKEYSEKNMKEFLNEALNQ